VARPGGFAKGRGEPQLIRDKSIHGLSGTFAWFTTPFRKASRACHPAFWFRIEGIGLKGFYTFVQSGDRMYVTSKFLGLVLTICCWTTVKGADEKTPEMFVTAGKYTSHGGRVIVEISPAKEGRLVFEVGFKFVLGLNETSNVTRLDTGLWEGEKWFMYPETGSRVWVFNGKDELLLFECKHTVDEMNSISGVARNVSSNSNPAIVKEAPKVVQDRLPQAFLNSLQRKK
jgi:hypothetical protein